MSAPSATNRQAAANRLDRVRPDHQAECEADGLWKRSSLAAHGGDGGCGSRLPARRCRCQLLYVGSNAETTTPHLHDGRGKEMDQQLICEPNLALIPATGLSRRHITFAVVSSLRGNLLRERDPAGRPR
jgi:hypothetical protein